MGMDLSYLEALMGGSDGASDSTTGGVWVVGPTGDLDDGVLRLIGRARVVADSLGCYVYLLLGGSPEPDAVQPAIHAGADRVLLAAGLPSVADLAGYLRLRDPQCILFPRTYWGRALGPGLAQALNGGLAAYAADLAVEPGTQRLTALQPVLDDLARQRVTLLKPPAVLVVDTAALPAAFSEPWRTGEIEQTETVWPSPDPYRPAQLPSMPQTPDSASLIVAVGRDLRESGVDLARQLAARLGGVFAGDIGALDAGWISHEQLVDLTGHTVAPKVYLALGISGDTGHLMAVRNAGTVISVQSDPNAPIVQMADWNVFADPAHFVRAMLERMDGQ
jgi:electron transfer flavoprotein alpha subunit